MNSFISKQVLLATVAGAIVAQTAAAKVSDKTLDISGQINFDASASDNKDYERDLRTQDAELKFGLLMKEGIRAVVGLELERQLELSGNGVMSDKFDVEKFLEEAYIEIQTDKITNAPRAVIIAGKQKVAFADNYTETPMFKDSLLHNLLNEDQVVGLTVSLPTSLIKIVDEMAMSVFETEAGDLAIGDNWGASVKLSKSFSEKMRATLAGMIKDQAGDSERRASLGVVFQSDWGYKMWAEGVVTEEHPGYSDTTYGARMGASRKLGPGAVVVEYAYLKDQAQELIAAYNLPVGSNMVLSPELRQTYADDANPLAKDDTRVGIRARIAAQKKAERPLIGK